MPPKLGNFKSLILEKLMLPLLVRSLPMKTFLWISVDIVFICPVYDLCSFLIRKQNLGHILDESLKGFYWPVIDTVANP